jgi:hypothetical protein
MTGTVLEVQFAFFIISCSVLLRMRNVSDKRCTEKHNTDISCLITFLFFENLAVYDVMWKNIVDPDRPQMTIWYGEWALHAVCPQNKYTYCFSTATMVARSRLNVTLYVHCLSRSSMYVFKVLCYTVSPQPMCTCVTLTTTDVPAAFPRVSSLYAFQFLSSSMGLLWVFICDAGV